MFCSMSRHRTFIAATCSSASRRSSARSITPPRPPREDVFTWRPMAMLRRMEKLWKKPVPRLSSVTMAMPALIAS